MRTVVIAVVLLGLSEWSKYTEFRTHTEDRLGTVETTLLTIKAAQNPVKTLGEIARLPRKAFAKALPAIRTAAEHPSSEGISSHATLQDIAEKLRHTNENAPEYWPTVLQFIRFASAGVSPNVPLPGTPNLHLSNIRARGKMNPTNEIILLDHGVIEDMTFTNCRIIFTENPVRMHNVRFVDCVFEIPITQSPNDYLKQASQEILGSDFASVVLTNLG